MTISIFTYALYGSSIILTIGYEGRQISIPLESCFYFFKENNDCEIYELYYYIKNFIMFNSNAEVSFRETYHFIFISINDSNVVCCDNKSEKYKIRRSDFNNFLKKLKKCYIEIISENKNIMNDDIINCETLLNKIELLGDTICGFSKESVCNFLKVQGLSPKNIKKTINNLNKSLKCAKNNLFVTKIDEKDFSDNVEGTFDSIKEMLSSYR